MLLWPFDTGENFYFYMLTFGDGVVILALPNQLRSVTTVCDPVFVDR